MISSAVYFKTNAMLVEAHEFADSVLYPESEKRNPSASPSSSTVRHEHTHWGNYPVWGYHPWPVEGRRSETRSDKKDHSWLAIPAACIALVALYFLGQNHAQWSSANNAIARLSQRKFEVQQEISSRHPVLASTIQSVFRKQEEILEHLRNEALKGLCLKGAFTASVIAAGIGGVASGGILVTSSAASLLPIGCIGTFLTSAAMIYRLGFSSQDPLLREKAQELQTSVHRAAALLKEGPLRRFFIPTFLNDSHIHR
jgi:hypothetical protein